MESIILFLIGLVIIFISYIISEKVTEQNKESGDFQAVQAGLVDSLLKENDEILKEKIENIIQERAEEEVDKVEEKLSHLSNEKIMAVTEFSDQILEKIDHNHNEVVFLYDMLNEKENEMKEFVQEIDKSKVVLEELANKELEKQKMIQHKRIQKELQQQIKKQRELERQKDELMMSGVLKSEIDIEQPSKEIENDSEVTTVNADEMSNTMIKEESVEAPTEENPREEIVPAKEEKVENTHSQEMDNSNAVILELYEQGKTIMEIAKILGKGQGEVKLVIDLFQGARN